MAVQEDNSYKQIIHGAMQNHFHTIYFVLQEIGLFSILTPFRVDFPPINKLLLQVFWWHLFSFELELFSLSQLCQGMFQLFPDYSGVPWSTCICNQHDIWSLWLEEELGSSSMWADGLGHHMLSWWVCHLKLLLLHTWPLTALRLLKSGDVAQIPGPFQPAWSCFPKQPRDVKLMAGWNSTWCCHAVELSQLIHCSSLWLLSLVPFLLP